MRYFDEMLTKYGFNDGEAVPAAADEYRAVYIKAINALAEQFGSQSRAVAWNRFGVHNWCLICFFPASELADVPAEDITTGIEGHERLYKVTEFIDDKMQDIIDELSFDSGDLDDMVIIDARISPNLDDEIEALAQRYAEEVDQSTSDQ